jgi:hypothetical protein
MAWIFRGHAGCSRRALIVAGSSFSTASMSARRSRTGCRCICHGCLRRRRAWARPRVPRRPQSYRTSWFMLLIWLWSSFLSTGAVLLLGAPLWRSRGSPAQGPLAALHAITSCVCARRTQCVPSPALICVQGDPEVAEQPGALPSSAASSDKPAGSSCPRPVDSGGRPPTDPLCTTTGRVC